MNNISKFSYCYGCGVCSTACRTKAISLGLNENGFYQPIIDPTKCTNCGLCLKVCAFNHVDVLQEFSNEVSPLAVWSNDSQTRKLCTSGGVGFELGKILLSKGYKAIVCKYNPDKQRAEHYEASTEEELRASIGSKYIQSYTKTGFSQIKKGDKFFITGTPCQIDSLRRWLKLRNMEDDVVLLDFFCHGVPSMLMWKKYLEEVKEKIGDFDHITWRSKPNGWHDSWVMVVEDRYKSYFTKGDMFYRMFLRDRCLGKACYENCKYKHIHSAADIRIGDLWGSTYARDEEGVNGVICLTQKGVEVMSALENVCHLEESTIDIVTESQMKKCAHRPSSHAYVMKRLRKGASLYSIDKWASKIEFIDKLKYYYHRLPYKLHIKR